MYWKEIISIRNQNRKKKMRKRFQDARPPRHGSVQAGFFLSMAYCTVQYCYSEKGEKGLSFPILPSCSPTSERACRESGEAKVQ